MGKTIMAWPRFPWTGSSPTIASHPVLPCPIPRVTRPPEMSSSATISSARVSGCRRLGEGDERAKPDPFGRQGRGRERWDRAEPGKVAMVPPGEVVVCPGMRETELFGPLPADARLAPWMLGRMSTPARSGNDEAI
jgi:hypothetical protein